MLAQLIPVDGGAPITIHKDVTIVGRQAEDCDLVVDQKSVSKLHCILVKTDGLLFVRDLSSTNGTKVNGTRIVRGALLPGDELAFASERFRVHLGPDPVNGHTENMVREGLTEVLAQAPLLRSQELEIFTGDDSSSDVRLVEDD